MTIILGLDPGLGTTGWGLIRAEGNRLSHLANGQLKTDAKQSLPRRLAHLATQLEALLADHPVDAAAAEEVFVNKNPQSTLKLAQARGVVLMIAARSGIEVGTQVDIQRDERGLHLLRNRPAKHAYRPPPP